MAHGEHASTDRLRHALAADADGSWMSAFVVQLVRLGDAAATAARVLEVPDLQQRCQALTDASQAGVRLLPRLRAALAASLPRVQLPEVSAPLLNEDTETSLLYELGWLSIEAGLEEDGLLIIESVGTLLHGTLGGAMYRVEALIAMGRAEPAAKLLADCLHPEVDVDGLAAATLASLWKRRSQQLGLDGEPEPLPWPTDLPPR